jgi:hypothetical protein
MIFQEQPTNREDQVNLVKLKLSKRFEKLHPKETFTDLNLAAVNPYEHAKMCYVSNNLFKFIRIENNSIRGFKKVCTASFTN